MQDLVGIIRTEEELTKSLGDDRGAQGTRQHLGVEGHRQYNPGWHLAMDLRNMLIVSECIAKAALERQESRGGHTRDDYPGPRTVGHQEPGALAEQDRVTGSTWRTSRCR